MTKSNKEGTIRSLKVSKLREDLIVGIKTISNLNSGSIVGLGGKLGKVSDRGIKVSVKGRLNGARRARTMVESEGGVSGNTLCLKHKSTSREIYTKWGVWQLKVSVS